MLFTTGQLRSTFSLSKQQWRSYREALSPLAKDHGKSGCFSSADLLATSVVHRINTSLSVPLPAFSGIALPLFELCTAHPWPHLERSSLAIDFKSRLVELVDHDRHITPAAITLLIELAPLVVELRERLLAGIPDPQRDLAFPPMIARSRR